MHQTATQDCADLHAAPECRHLFTEITSLREPVLHGLESSAGMVISHGEMTETTLSRLFNQVQRLETPITALGMAVKIADIRAAVWTDVPEDGTKRM